MFQVCAAGAARTGGGGVVEDVSGVCSRGSKEFIRAATDATAMAETAAGHRRLSCTRDLKIPSIGMLSAERYAQYSLNLNSCSQSSVNHLGDSGISAPQTPPITMHED